MRTPSTVAAAAAAAAAAACEASGGHCLSIRRISCHCYTCSHPRLPCRCAAAGGRAVRPAGHLWRGVCAGEGWPSTTSADPNASTAAAPCPPAWCCHPLRSAAPSMQAGAGWGDLVHDDSRTGRTGGRWEWPIACPAALACNCNIHLEPSPDAKPARHCPIALRCCPTAHRCSRISHCGCTCRPQTPASTHPCLS